jgi:hypothetical protein
MEEPEPLKQASILAEYASLRNQIGGYIQRQDQVSAVSFPIAGAVFAYAYLNSSAIAYLAVIFVFAIALGLGATAVANTIRVGSYISTLIESKVTGLQWETILAKQRHKNRSLMRSDYLYLARLWPSQAA